MRVLFRALRRYIHYSKEYDVFIHEVKR